jgi:RNA polymerase sigma-70 factor (ECF subfamily)
VRSFVGDAGAAAHEVGDRGDDQKRGRGADDRPHALGAIGSPRGNEEPDGQRHRERPFLVRDVNGRRVIPPVDQQRSRDHRLRDRRRDEATACPRQPRGSLRRPAPVEHRAHEHIGRHRHATRRLEPHAARHLVGEIPPPAAVGAPIDVLVEAVIVNAGGLAVEPGRDRLSRGVAVHSEVVERDPGSVPGRDVIRDVIRDVTRLSAGAYGGEVDELTRLAHEARRAVPGSLDAFIRASHEPVWRLCEALVDAQSADDLTQETFVKAVSAIRRFRGDASARTWILSIARYTCMDELRARNRGRRRSAAMAAGATEAPLPDPSGEIGARDLLRHLEVDRRAAFTLTQLLGLTYAEAAETCDCPVGTIRSRVARARDDLIEMLAGTMPDRETRRS